MFLKQFGNADLGTSGHCGIHIRLVAICKPKSLCEAISKGFADIKECVESRANNILVAVILLALQAGTVLVQLVEQNEVVVLPDTLDSLQATLQSMVVFESEQDELDVEPDVLDSEISDDPDSVVGDSVNFGS
jgi:hypothetical protein